jgi:hypothetical protein
MFVRMWGRLELRLIGESRMFRSFGFDVIANMSQCRSAKRYLDRSTSLAASYHRAWDGCAW